MRLPATNHGFTLVELMVVIAIIGLLASTVMSNLGDARAKARDIRRIQDMRSIITALEFYHQKYRHYPCSGETNSDDPDFLAPLVAEKYLTARPTDPQNTDGYRYYYTTFKSGPGGECGQYVMLTYDIESAETKCMYGGAFVTATHCHVPYPGPLPCNDPWLFGEGSGMAPSCSSLHD